MPHVPRAPLAARFPVHVTTRTVDIRCLRRGDVFRVVRDALVAGADREGFRVAEFSVQANHLHLVCEASNRQALARGLQGLLIRIAKRLNRFLGRTGRVFRDRYHDRILRTPAEVRNVLSYVLHNARKHARENGRRVGRGWLDRCSSARAFFGLDPMVLPRAHTWLLREGWQRAGTLHPLAP